MSQNFDKINHNNFCFLLYLFSLNTLRTETISDQPGQGRQNSEVLVLFHREFARRRASMDYPHITSVLYSFGRNNIKSEDLITACKKLTTDLNYRNQIRARVSDFPEYVKHMLYSCLYLSGFKDMTKEESTQIGHILLELYQEVDSMDERSIPAWKLLETKKIFSEFTARICLNFAKSFYYSSEIVNI
jgi:hypothetical protein